MNASEFVVDILNISATILEETDLKEIQGKLLTEDGSQYPIIELLELGVTRQERVSCSSFVVPYSRIMNGVKIASGTEFKTHVPDVQVWHVDTVPKNRRFIRITGEVKSEVDQAAYKKMPLIIKKKCVRHGYSLW